MINLHDLFVAAAAALTSWIGVWLKGVIDRSIK